MSNRSSDLLNIKGKNKEKAVENLLKSKDTIATKEIPFPLPTNNSSLPPLGSSDILSRVQAFLPQIKTANEKLEKADPSALNIENVDEEEQYIEMNLGLGVYSLKKPGETTDSDESSSEEEEDKTKKPLVEVMDQD